MQNWQKAVSQSYETYRFAEAFINYSQNNGSMRRMANKW